LNSKVFVVVVLVCAAACGSGDTNSASCVDVHSDAGVGYFGELDFNTDILPERGRELIDGCGNWTQSAISVGDSGQWLRLDGLDETGKAVAELSWYRGLLDSWRATIGWKGKFDGVIEIGMLLEVLLEHRPHLNATDFDGIIEENVGRYKIFYHFDNEQRLRIIFVRHRDLYRVFQYDF